YRPKTSLTDREHEEIHRQLRPAEDRFAAWDDEEARDKWRGSLQAFVRLYAFLSQVMPYADRELEVRYSFGRLLLKRLPRAERDRVELDGEVDLHSYRLARLGETDIALNQGEVGEVRGPTAVGTRKATDEEVPLHEVIEILNERFGTDFTKSDQLVVEQIIEDGKADAQVQARVAANTFENFSLSIEETITGLMIDRMDRNQSLVTKFLNEDELRRLLTEHIAKRIYEDLKKAG
nr:type I restriction endonuclease subunit R [Myxococcota bacterium]